jgi:hypothetical protein
MRGFLVSIWVCAVVLVPKVGTGQAYSLPTPPPQVSAASAPWYISGDPVFFAGSFYYPTGPTVFFDGNVMVRSGMYQGVPLYTDTTLEAYSMVFVPIGGRVVRPYERRREGELAGTVGSRPPSFPIQRDGDLSVASGRPGIQTPELRTFDAPVIPEASRVGTAGTSAPTALAAPSAVSAPAANAADVPRANVAPPPPKSAPRPTGNDGVWIQHDGVRWFASGPAVPFDSQRFTPAGEYHGFPVYRDTMGRAATIFVAVVAGGPVAPYTRR